MWDLCYVLCCREGLTFLFYRLAFCELCLKYCDSSVTSLVAIGLLLCYALAIIQTLNLLTFESEIHRKFVIYAPLIRFF
jgi:hypothetical protein